MMYISNHPTMHAAGLGSILDRDTPKYFKMVQTTSPVHA